LRILFAEGMETELLFMFWLCGWFAGWQGEFRGPKMRKVRVIEHVP